MSSFAGGIEALGFAFSGIQIVVGTVCVGLLFWRSSLVPRLREYLPRSIDEKGSFEIFCLNHHFHLVLPPLVLLAFSALVKLIALLFGLSPLFLLVDIAIVALLGLAYLAGQVVPSTWVHWWLVRGMKSPNVVTGWKSAAIALHYLDDPPDEAVSQAEWALGQRSGGPGGLLRRLLLDGVSRLPGPRASKAWTTITDRRPALDLDDGQALRRLAAREPGAVVEVLKEKAKGIRGAEQLRDERLTLPCSLARIVGEHGGPAEASALLKLLDDRDVVGPLGDVLAISILDALTVIAARSVQVWFEGDLRRVHQLPQEVKVCFTEFAVNCRQLRGLAAAALGLPEPAEKGGEAEVMGGSGCPSVKRAGGIDWLVDRSCDPPRWKCMGCGRFVTIVFEGGNAFGRHGGSPAVG